ncbi:hypothetical protein KIPB_008377, partial [Kipferlia bialata]|eukprot:g8377.t1
MCQTDTLDRDHSQFTFLTEGFKFPKDPSFEGILLPVEDMLKHGKADTVHVPRASSTHVTPRPNVCASVGVQSLLSCGGLLVGFQARTGLPVIPPARTGLPVIPPLGTHPVLKAALPLSLEGGQGAAAFTAYVRPKEARHVDVRSVLIELTTLLDMCKRGMDLLEEWSSTLGHPTLVVPHSLSDPDLPGHPYQVARVTKLIYSAENVLVQLNETPVNDLEVEDMEAVVQEARGCLKEVEAIFNTPNRTFATALRRLLDRVLPSVELVRLVTAPSLRHRHLDILESSTGLPVLLLDEVSVADLVDKGALDKMDPIQEVVDMADEEAQVEDRLDTIQRVLDSWTVEVDVSPDIDGGFPLPDNFFPTLRAMLLFVQRDVGSTYATPITLRARKLESTLLWVLHTGSMIRYTQQYLELGNHLLSKVGDQYSQLYFGPLKRWYQVRRSLQRRASVRLIDVLQDMELPDIL